MHVRRVVTGHDEHGRSVFASDDAVDAITVPLFAGWEFLPVWGGDRTPRFPDAGAHPPAGPYFPAAGGFRFSFSLVPPEGTPPAEGLDPVQAEAEAERLLPGLLAHMEADDPGMHTTDTIDFEVIISGEVILELDDGAER